MDPRSKPSVVHELPAFRAAMNAARARGLGVAFVPTMGALHEGHLSLLRHARTLVGDAGFLTASIFVNPTQFGPKEDFSRYPRELEDDVARCASVGTDLVFAPERAAMYPEGEQTRVHVGALAEPLCGEFRPGHFEGVATVVAKLFALAGPCVAVFGRKDYQQVQVLRRMVTDLFLPVQIVAAPTLRESDGLAMSSRNRYLSPEQRAKAAVIPRALGDAVRAWNAGERRAETLEAIARAPLATAFDSIDYVSVRSPETLGPLENSSSKAVLAIAVRTGTTRLIDNVVLGEDPPPQ